jgi:hypothetical protein
VIPEVVRATGTISKSLRLYLSNIPAIHETKDLQNSHIGHCTLFESVNIKVKNITFMFIQCIFNKYLLYTNMCTYKYCKYILIQICSTNLCICCYIIIFIVQNICHVLNNVFCFRNVIVNNLHNNNNSSNNI